MAFILVSWIAPQLKPLEAFTSHPPACPLTRHYSDYSAQRSSRPSNQSEITFKEKKRVNELSLSVLDGQEILEVIFGEFI